MDKARRRFILCAVPAFFKIDDLQGDASSIHRLFPPARLAVIGDPIAHSKSPQMHNPALAACGINAQYIRVQVPVGRVGDAFRLFAARGFIGINVTIPHKFEALQAVDELDPLARRLGAVNTVAIRDGRLCGFNSDGPGFLCSVREGFGADVRDLRVMILGAGGGAGRAVAVQCALEGCPRLVLVNRTAEKLEDLLADIRSIGSAPASTDAVLTLPWTDEALQSQIGNIDLIVNGTSLGMRQDDPPLLPAKVLSPRHWVFDMVYRPGGEMTALGLAARAAGSSYIDGATLLLHQGAISFEYWFHRPAPLEVMRAGLREALAA